MRVRLTKSQITNLKQIFFLSNHITFINSTLSLHRQALNQLFEKIMALDIDERHLLRLGHGEEELETEKDFSRWGRAPTGAGRGGSGCHGKRLG